MTTRVPRGLAWLALVGLAGCDLSIAQEDELGDLYAASIQAQLRIHPDPEAGAALTAMGRRIAAVADDASRDWHFHVVDDTVVNAFAVPGGHIFVHRGLIELAGGYGELAGVLAHEVAHVTLRHSVEQLRARTRTSVLVSVFCSFVPVCGGTVAQIAIDAGGQLLLARYSREDEREADSASVGYLVAAGIDPRGIPAMFARLEEVRRADPGALATWFGTHPLERERIAGTERLIGAIAPDALDHLTSADAVFDQLKSRLRDAAKNGPSRPGVP